MRRAESGYLTDSDICSMFPAFAVTEPRSLDRSRPLPFERTSDAVRRPGLVRQAHSALPGGHNSA